MNTFWVIGRHPVEELLTSKEQKALKVIVASDTPRETKQAVSSACREANVPVSDCSRAEWGRRTGDRENGHIAAEVAEYRYKELEPWLERLPESASVLILDGVTDPQNFGAVIRSARAFGIDGVVVPKDRSCPVTGSVFRASAGAAAHVSVVPVTNLSRALEMMKEAGFWTYAAEGSAAEDATLWKPAKRTAIVLGNEETGVRRLVREHCDGSLRIPMSAGIDSLNVSVTAGIFSFLLRKV